MKNKSKIMRNQSTWLSGVSTAFCICLKKPQNLSKLIFFCCPFSAMAQGIKITPGTQLVMNGSPYIVANDAAFINNGRFKEATGTIKFTGYGDTTTSYVSGSSSTTFYNASVEKNGIGVALKSSTNVKNTLTVTGGKLYANSKLTLLSDAALTARVAAVASGSDIIGTAFVQRYIPAKRAWRLMTAPVTNSESIYNTWQNGGLFEVGKGMLVSGPGGNNGLDRAASSSLKTYNSNTQALEEVSNTYSSISPGNSGNADNAGYFVFIRGDRNPNNFSIPNTNTTTITASGKLQVGTQNFNAAPNYGAYTLIGNPFASPINFSNISRNNLLKRFYVWDPSINTGGAYVVLDDLDNDGTYTKSVFGSQQTAHIQSTQAFFVQTSANGAASLSIPETAKSSNNNNAVFRPQSPASPASTTESIRATLYLLNNDNSTQLADGVVAEGNPLYSDAVTLEDAVKFTNINENLGLYRHGTFLAVERRPYFTTTDTLFLKLWKTTQRNYQLEFEVNNLAGLGVQAFLIDSYLNTTNPLNTEGFYTYNFAIDGNPASANVNRFMIVFKPLLLIPLQVNSTQLNGALLDDAVALGWKVTNEQQLLQYEIEKSIDGSHYYRLAIHAKHDSSNTSGSYQYMDENPVAGTNYYRIQSMDVNGSYKTSNVVAINNAPKGLNITAFPNPVKGNVIHLLFAGQSKGIYRLRLINQSGQVVYHTNLQMNNGETTRDVPLGKKIAAGMYTLEISDTDIFNVVQRIIIE